MEILHPHQERLIINDARSVAARQRRELQAAERLAPILERGVAIELQHLEIGGAGGAVLSYDGRCAPHNRTCRRSSKIPRWSERDSYRSPVRRCRKTRPTNR